MAKIVEEKMKVKKVKSDEEKKKLQQDIMDLAVNAKDAQTHNGEVILEARPPDNLFIFIKDEKGQRKDYCLKIEEIVKI